MAYSRTTSAWLTLDQPFAAYAATLPESQRQQLYYARPFLARFLAAQCPGLPAFDAQTPVDEWMARVPLVVLRDLTRLEEALSAPQLAADLGYKKTSVRHYRHLLKGFFAWYRQLRADDRRPDPISEAWERVLDQVATVVPAKQVGTDRHYLRKLAIQATRAGIAPQQLDTRFTAEYRAYLFEESGLRDPGRLYAGVKKVWGPLAAAGVVPAVDFYQRPRKGQVRIRREQLPVAYQIELQEIERCLRSDDPDEWITRDRHRSHPFAEETVENILRAVEDFLGALVFDHHLELAAIPFPQLLVDSQYLERWGESLVTRKGQLMEWHQTKLRLVCTVAEIYLPRRWPGLTVDLAGFRLWLNQQEGWKKPRRPGYLPPAQVEVVLTDLETQIRHLSERQPPGAPTLLLPKMRDHFLIAFLLENALRQGNLRRAQIGQQIVEQADGVSCLFSTKNGRNVALALTPRVHRSYTRYMAQRQRMGLLGADLLVSHTGKPMSTGQIWQQVTRIFHRTLGVHFTPQDFRRTLSSRILLETGDTDLALLLIADGTAEILALHYDVVEPEAGFKLYQDLVHAVEHHLPTARPPAVQHFLPVAEDPQQRRQLRALMAQMAVAPAPIPPTRTP